MSSESKEFRREQANAATTSKQDIFKAAADSNLRKKYWVFNRWGTPFAFAIFIFLALIFIAAFAVGGVGTNAFMWVSLGGFVFSFVVGGYFLIKADAYAPLADTIDQIERHETIKITDLILYEKFEQHMVAEIVDRLIESKNLVGYKLIGGVGVAKNEIDVSEEYFDLEEGATVPVKCKNCGAARTRRSGKFCEYCSGKF